MSIETIVYGVLSIALLAVVFWFQGSHDRQQKKLLQAQAEKRNGTVDKFQVPRLLLRFDNLYLQVRAISNNDTKKTIAELGGITLESLAGEVQKFPKVIVFKRNSSGNSNSPSGQKTVQLGNGEFDNIFVIYTEDEKEARRVLTNDIQRNMLFLAAMSPKIDYSQLLQLFSVAGIIKDSNTYDVFIDTAIAILKNLRQQEP